jgi:signal transduction histidine kinase
MRKLARAVGSAARALEQREQRLRAQNEEVQGQNEEIQAQTEELQAQSEELQAQHEEIQAQNEQLKQQADELNEADQRKNRFLGVLAHELRNPMAPISNSLALLRRSPAGSEHALRAQAMIERQVRHLIRLIDDLLDVTRISQGKIRLQREELDLVEIVRACIEDQQATLEPGERSIRFIAPQGPVLLNGDRTRLSQIAGNLLSNAVKFTDRGGSIVVELRADPARKSASLHVSDDGVGLDADLLPLLFQPFAQGAGSLDRTHSGLGLGLSLVRALAELHGGEVSGSSEGPGRGAQFVVTLPVLA